MGDGSDVSTALLRLSFSVDSLNKQIKEQVVTHYEELLGQVTGIKELSAVLSTVQTDIGDLNQSLQSLASKIRDPYQQLQTYCTQLENLQNTSDLLRRLHRFLLLVRRLETQLISLKQETGERDMSSAALTLHELSVIMKEADFDGLDAVSSKLELIQQGREYIQEEASRLIKEGIDSRLQAKMAAGLQVFYNMKEMGQRVEILATKILEDLTDQIKHVVDMQSLQKEIYSLEKVLELKKDSFTQVSFQEEITKVFDAPSLVSYFWRVLSATFEKELKEATKVSTFLQNTFVGDYPRLLRLVYDFFSRVAIHNGTSLSDYSQSPEYVIMLRSFGTFEGGFLARSLTKMYDAINAAFSSPNNIKRVAPTRPVVQSVIRVIESELETSAFEPHLAQLVARNVVKALSMFCVKCEALSVWRILDEFPEKTVDIVKQGAEECRGLMVTIGQHLVKAIKVDVERVLVRMHQEDFSGQLRHSFDLEQDTSAGSYIMEFSKHVRYYHGVILSKLSCGAEPKLMAIEISKYAFHIFVFQGSMVRPLSEAGKLKLAGDMAELEFNMNQFVGDYGGRIEEVGQDYKALRAFRPLLFLNSAQLTAAHHTTGLSKLTLIHHLAVRSQSSSRPLPLPHTVYNLPRLEYMKWIDQQSEKEGVELALAAIQKGSKMTEEELQEVPEYRWMMELVDPST
ncbi:Golgi transport complex subunit 5-domain-containing protein [Spinellus fusiger]|nr:Golgi transport complex subunit 5-domain-containing protein [Spinellus fusiger]